MKGKKSNYILLLIILLGLGTLALNHITAKPQNSLETIDDYTSDLLTISLYLIDEGRIDKMISCAEQALQADTDSFTKAEAKFILGYINSYNAGYDEALTQLEEARDLLENISPSEHDSYYPLKFCLYSQLAFTYEALGDSDNASLHYEKLAQESSSEKFAKYYIKYSSFRAYDLYTMKNDVEGALDILYKVLEIAQSTNYEEIEYVYLDLGTFHSFAGEYVLGVNYKLKALELVEKKNVSPQDPEYNTWLDIILNIGNDYMALGNTDAAIQYFTKALESPKATNEGEVDMALLANAQLLEVYTKLEDTENCRKYYSSLLDVISKYDGVQVAMDTHVIADILIASTEIRENNIDIAFELLEKARKQYEATTAFSYYNIDSFIAEILGDAYYAKGDYKNALAQHTAALDIIIERNYDTDIDILYQKISDDYVALGDDTKALEALHSSIAVKDDRMSNDSIQYSQYLVSEFEAAKKDEAIQALEAQKLRRNNIIVLIGTILALVLLGSFEVTRKNKEIRKLNKKLEDISNTDNLTTLANRHALENYLEGLWAHIKPAIPVSIMMMDIDFFKKYNDNYGHPEGDFVLASVAKILKHLCGENNFVARYGGEEFIIVMKNSTKEDADRLAMAIKEKLAEINLKHEYSDVSNHVTLSIGGATTSDKNLSYKELIKLADEALYSSKHNGKNRFTHYDDCK